MKLLTRLRASFTRGMLGMLCILALVSTMAAMPAKASATDFKLAAELSFETGPPIVGVVYDKTTYEFRTVSITPMRLSYQEEPPARTWSGAVYYDLKSRTSSAILTYPVTTFTRVFGTNLSLELLSFAGVTIEEQPSGLGGFIVGKSGKLADQITGFVGLGFPVIGNVPKSLGLAAGLSVKF
jgi:hypothetical protein